MKDYPCTSSAYFTNCKAKTHLHFYHCHGYPVVLLPRAPANAVFGRVWDTEWTSARERQPGLSPFDILIGCLNVQSASSYPDAEDAQLSCRHHRIILNRMRWDLSKLVSFVAVFAPPDTRSEQSQAADFVFWYSITTPFAACEQRWCVQHLVQRTLIM